jgi:pSer/pThr/pTyr-binding forkhead associated (FHA) protein
MRDTAPSLPRVALLLEDGTFVELKGKERYLVGRRKFSGEDVPDVDLRDLSGGRTVSRKHALIHVSPDGVSVEDLGSRNTTQRNGFLLLPHQLYPLEDNDELCFGTVSLLVRVRGHQKEGTG